MMHFLQILERNHLKCHLHQIELNNRLLYILHHSIKVSLVAFSVQQLIYLLVTGCCVLTFLSINLQRLPCPL
jgi:hypothetical protein